MNVLLALGGTLVLLVIGAFELALRFGPDGYQRDGWFHYGKPPEER